MSEYGFSVARILPYMDRVCDFVLVREKRGHRKPVFWRILPNAVPFTCNRRWADQISFIKYLSGKNQDSEYLPNKNRFIVNRINIKEVLFKKKIIRKNLWILQNLSEQLFDRTAPGIFLWKTKKYSNRTHIIFHTGEKRLTVQIPTQTPGTFNKQIFP